MLVRRTTLAAIALLEIGVFACKSDPQPRPEPMPKTDESGDDEFAVKVDSKAIARLDLGQPRRARLIPGTRRARLAHAAREAAPAPGPERTITFVNACAEPIWVAAEGNTTQGGWAMNAAADCTVAGCPTGQRCDPESKACALEVRVPSNFSGRLWPRTDCGEGPCPTDAASERAPATVVEVAFQPDASDYYDISLIDGFNLPIEVAPRGDFAACELEGEHACDYWCTNPGSPNPSHGLAACPWTKVLDATCAGRPELRSSEFAGCTTVKAICTNPSSASVAARFDCDELHPGSVACSTTANCPMLIGMKFADRAACACPANTQCMPIEPGDPASEWSCRATCVEGSCKTMACSSDADCPPETFLRCDLTAGSSTEHQCVSTNASLHAASGTNGQTCYGEGQVADVTALCAGCPTASNAANAGAWTNATASCQADDGVWQLEVLPWLTAFKRACPTAYSFPFDDPTSTFTCRTSGASNRVDYTITFCPRGS
ncbi:thaumatin family protein [Nannocystaceae bacterium ST9]